MTIDKTVDVTEQISRKDRGELIARADGAIKRIDDSNNVVLSQSGNGVYEIHSTDLGWVCSCPDHKFRGVKCKHIHAVEISFALRKEVEVRRIAPITSVTNCIFCNSSNIVKDGLRHNKHGDIQKYNCKDCKQYFSINFGFERMKTSPQTITAALQLYFSSESLRNTQKFFRLQGLRVHHNTIYKWIKKYVGLIKTYLARAKPNVSDVWRADELYLKVKGNPKYLYALMDDETRFWIAQQVADTKYTSSLTPLLKRAKEVAQKRPNTFITDGDDKWKTLIQNSQRNARR